MSGQIRLEKRLTLSSRKLIITEYRYKKENYVCSAGQQVKSKQVELKSFITFQNRQFKWLEIETYIKKDLMITKGFS